ncbi:LysR family transcriptional regulator [Roseovarius sp. B08]|uniref:LysR family transcriptional regulator n=1 Tax=Roseovarius sp. B08 TaxID=3449223 RepID=UPI003EDB7A8C
MIDALTLEAGSFRGSAKHLSRVQSAISYAVGNLETQLGVALFDRSGHRPVLTPEGQSLLADARAVLVKVDAMRARARGLSEGIELGLSVVIDALYPLPRVMAALHAVSAQYGGVGIRWPANDLRILSIDGGGIKGILPAAVLAECERRFLKGGSAASYFDMIAGTSTGGIIALGMAAGCAPRRFSKSICATGRKYFLGLELRQLDLVARCDPLTSLPAILPFIDTIANPWNERFEIALATGHWVRSMCV